MLKTALLGAFTGLILSACGSVGTGAAPSPTPSWYPPGLGYDVVVGEKDHAATLRVGQKLELVLHAYSGMTTWSQVRSSDTSILTATVNPAATAAQGVTLAAFRAVAPGEVDVTAIATPVCAAGQACPALAMLYRLQVTVTS
jgi:hypothetical protein